jgi:hypothetical protein
MCEHGKGFVGLDKILNQILPSGRKTADEDS